jgi:class 3 adenylate cyclase
VKTDYTNRLRETLPALSKAAHLEEKEYKPTAYFFFSLDLANSTRYKTEHEDWPLVFSRFYDVADQEMKKISGARLWKYVGDEILFYKKVEGDRDLQLSLASFLTISKTTTKSLWNESKTARSAKLSTKPSAWIAMVGRMASRELNVPLEDFRPGTASNLLVKLGNAKDPLRVDFLGPDIDVGFRISAFSRPGTVAISAELARALLKIDESKSAEKMRVVTYKKLRGAWNGRAYPIV